MARRVTLYIYFLRPDRQGPTLGPIHALTKKASLSHIYRFAKIQLFACFTSQRTLFSHEAKNGRRHGQLPSSTHRHAASSALFQYDRGQKTDCWRGSTTIEKASDSTKGNSRMKPAIPQKAGAEKAPEGTANKRSALRSPTQHAATSYAVRCDGRCSALRQSVGRLKISAKPMKRGILLGQQPPAHALQTAPKQRPESKQASPDASVITSNTSSQTGSRPCAPRSCRAWRRS